MLDIKKNPVNMLEENCYVVSDDTREAVVIDCGALTDDDRRRITDYIEDRRLQVRHHLCTHMHYDHCFGAAFIGRPFMSVRSSTGRTNLYIKVWERRYSDRWHR